MKELYVYSTMMSPENQGVFQHLKEVTFRRIVAFLQLNAKLLVNSLGRPENCCNLNEILIL